MMLDTSSEEETLLSTPRIDSDSEGFTHSSRRKRVPPAISMMLDTSSEEETLLSTPRIDSDSEGFIQSSRRKRVPPAILSSSTQQHQTLLDAHSIPATTPQDATKRPIQRLRKTKKQTVQRPPKLPKDPSKDTPRRQAEEVINLCGEPNPIPNLDLNPNLHPKPNPNSNPDPRRRRR
jgi:hypothetical protein